MPFAYRAARQAEVGFECPSCGARIRLSVSWLSKTIRVLAIPMLALIFLGGFSLSTKLLVLGGLVVIPLLEFLTFTLELDD